MEFMCAKKRRHARKLCSTGEKRGACGDGRRGSGKQAGSERATTHAFRQRIPLHRHFKNGISPLHFLAECLAVSLWPEKSAAERKNRRPLRAGAQS